MSSTAWIIIFIVLLLFSFLVYFTRRNKAHKEVNEINDDINEENEKYVQLMNKIIEHKSFEIIDSKEKIQIVKFDASVFNFGNVDWKNLPKTKIKWLFNFLAFLIFENWQLAFIRIKNGFLSLEKDESDEWFLSYLTKSQLNKIISTIKKEFICECGHSNCKNKEYWNRENINSISQCGCCTSNMPKSKSVKKVIKLKRYLNSKLEWRIFTNYDSYEEAKSQFQEFGYDDEYVDNSIYKLVEIFISSNKFRNALSLKYKKEMKKWVWENNQKINFKDPTLRNIILFFYNNESQKWQSSFGDYRSWKEIYEEGPHKSFEKIKKSFFNGEKSSNEKIEMFKELVNDALDKNELDSSIFKFIELKITKNNLENAFLVKYQNNNYVILDPKKLQNKSKQEIHI